MVLCDVGNTFLHFFYKGKMWRESADKLSKIRPEVRIFYISVSQKSEKKLLKSHKNCVNLAPYFELNTEYKGLGIDRVAACVGAQDGIIIDAGSAITIDVMQFGVHLGGCIMPGLASYRQMYGAISPVLEKEFDLSVNVNALPQDTKSAMSYGVIKSIILTIKECANGKKLYFTGGDGKYFCKFFEDGIYDSTLVFKGMKKAYEKYAQMHELDSETLQKMDAKKADFQNLDSQNLDCAKPDSEKLDSQKSQISESKDDEAKAKLVAEAIKNIRAINGLNSEKSDSENSAKLDSEKSTTKDKKSDSKSFISPNSEKKPNDNNFKEMFKV